MQPRVYVTRSLPPQGEEPPTREEVIENIRNKDAI